MRLRPRLNRYLMKYADPICLMPGLAPDELPQELQDLGGPAVGEEPTASIPE
ncbi:MAG TPA: hypothetical protein VK674_04365 [Candidatus Limnocylindria bacterium]|nr:hypothetical protein [Candidatus Limnocylindria bacterium]